MVNIVQPKCLAFACLYASQVRECEGGPFRTRQFSICHYTNLHVFVKQWVRPHRNLKSKQKRISRELIRKKHTSKNCKLKSKKKYRLNHARGVVMFLPSVAIERKVSRPTSDIHEARFLGSYHALLSSGHKSGLF